MYLPSLELGEMLICPRSEGWHGGMEGIGSESVDAVGDMTSTDSSTVES